MNSLAIALSILAYLGCIAYLGYRGYRKTVSHQDYLVAGRSVHPFVMAMSYGAAFISTSAIVGFGGMAGWFGMGLLWLSFMNIALGIFVAFVFFGKRTRELGTRLEANTFPEFIGRRFDSRGIKIFLALVIFCFMPLYSSVVLIGGARFLQEVLSLQQLVLRYWPGLTPEAASDWGFYLALVLFAGVVAIYVTLGGLKGAMYVDALMGSIMVLGMVTLLGMSYWELGGVAGAHRELTAMAPLVPESLRELGHVGWTAMPRFNSEWWWTLVSSLMLGVGIGALAQPQLAVRFMTVKSGRELNRATLIGAVFILLTVGVAYEVGALSNVYFYRASGRIAIEAAGGNPDLIIPQFIHLALPRVMVYIFTLTLLSAAMSTLSSLFHVVGTTIGHDLYRSLGGRRGGIGVPRLGVVAGIVLSLVLGFVLPGGIIARGTAIFFGICAAGFLPTYVAALYWPRATRAGVWASMAVGVGASLFGLVFLHRKESAALGICRAWFGCDELVSSFPWPFVDPLIYSLPLSALALVVVSLLCRSKPGARTEKNPPRA